MILFLSLLQFSRQSQFKSSSSVFVCFLFMFCDMFVIYYCTLLLVIFLCSQSLSFPKIQFSFHLFYPSCEILLLNSVTSGFDWHISSSYEAVYRSTSLDSMNNKTKHETRHTWLHKETTSLRSHNAPPREHVVFVRTCFCWAHKTSDGEVPPRHSPVRRVGDDGSRIDQVCVKQDQALAAVQLWDLYGVPHGIGPEEKTGHVVHGDALRTLKVWGGNGIKRRSRRRNR